MKQGTIRAFCGIMAVVDIVAAILIPMSANTSELLKIFSAVVFGILGIGFGICFLKIKR